MVDQFLLVVSGTELCDDAVAIQSDGSQEVWVKLRAGNFLVADLNASGELQSSGEYCYAALEQVPGAAELIGHFSGLLWRSPDGFEGPVDAELSRLTFRWRACSPGTGIATLRCGSDLVSVTLLCSGISEQQDRITQEILQQHLLRELRDTGFEPAFALMDLEKRPLAASINFQTPPDSRDRHVAALADRCFAASFFRYHGLA